MATTLYDAFGREYTPPKRPETREVATVTLRDRWSTYPADGLTPERLASIFKEADLGDVLRQSELFEQLEEKDTHLSSVLHTRKLAVCGCELAITPASESAEDKTIAAFVEEALAWIENWDDALLDLLDAIGKGFAASEIRWELEGSKVWIRELAWRHAKRFTFLDRDRVLPWPKLVTDANPVWGEDLTPWQWIVHRYKARSGMMSRAGILRTCAWMYLFKNYGIKDWVVFAEVYGMPLRLGKYDPGASPDDRAALIAAVRSLGTDAAGVISKSTEIEFVEAVKGGQGNNVFDQLVSFCNAEMSKAVLGQTLTTEIGKTGGAFAASQTHNTVRGDLLDADAKSLARTLRHQLVRPLVGFNFGWDTALPELTLAPEEAEDLQAAATTLKTLTEAGFRGIPVKYIHEKFAIPEPAGEEEVLSPPAAFGSPGGPGPTSDPSKMSDPSGVLDQGLPADPAAGPVKQDVKVATAAVLNGAQITAATAIVTAVAAGEIPRDSGVGQLMVLFNLTKEQAEQIMGSAGTGAPTTPNPKPDGAGDGSDSSAGGEEQIPPGPPLPKGGEKKQTALKDGARRDPMDPEVEAALAASDDPMAALQAPVRALIASAESMEALRDGLLNLYPDMDPTAMGNLLHRAFLLSHAIGRRDIGPPLAKGGRGDLPHA